MASSIIVIRHSDRLDYEMGIERWKDLSNPEWIFDPPLSDLGTAMALETAAAVNAISLPNGKPITKVISSPFLRCIQTANPIAGKLDLPILLDDCLFEIPCGREPLPGPADRRRYFPRVSTEYVSTFRPQGHEIFPQDCLDRCGAASIALANRFPGENIVIVTHAASVVATVACLTRTIGGNIPPAFPCGIYSLDLVAGAEEEEAIGTADVTPATATIVRAANACCVHRYVLSSEFSGSIKHLSRLGSTAAWPLPKNPHGAMFIGAETNWLVE